MSAASGPRCYRRRGPVFLECGDRLWLDPMLLLRGKLVPQRLPLLRAYAPPSARPVEIEPLAGAFLAAFSSGVARPVPHALERIPGAEAALQVLLDAGLIELGSDAEEGAAETVLDAAPLDDWFGPAALYHFASRWSKVVARDEVPADPRSAKVAFAASVAAFDQQARARGAPPEHFPTRGDVAHAIELPQMEPTSFDTLLAARETHRLFDPERPLELAQVAGLLDRSFGARSIAALGGGLHAIRKYSPSGGGMHPLEAYPLVVNVRGLDPGWYHYRAGEHRLSPMRLLDRGDARDAIERVTAGQSYFASAPLLVAMTLRFPRHHWKYPQHGRALRVMQLEAGHVGQTFYLSATEAGLGAFFTAAVNDADVDDVLGLNGVDEGCIAVVGCGHPSAEGGALRLSNYVSG